MSSPSGDVFQLSGSALYVANNNKAVAQREGSFYLYFHDVTGIVGGRQFHKKPMRVSTDREV